MKLGAQPESLIERIGLWLGLVPVALLDTHVAASLARTVVAGVRLGVFEALDGGPRTVGQIAADCGSDPEATGLLVEALASNGYVRYAHGRYELTQQSRKWLTRSSRHSIRDKILFQAVEWDWLSHLETFVRTGQPLDFHAAMCGEQFDLYQRAMRALAGVGGGEVGWRTPVPRGARRMLDLGGSHGHLAAEICRRHNGLSAEVFDLPAAVDKAAPLLAAEGLGERLKHVRGNVLSADLGEGVYDLVLMSNLAHHLDDAQNQALAHKVARALRPGGFFVIQEPARPAHPGQDSQTGSLLGLYFALQSRPHVKTWTVAEMAAWQRCAGLQPRRPLRLRTAPGWVQQSARRPR